MSMVEILKTVWEVFVALLVMTKAFWWSDFIWINIIKYGILLVCFVFHLSSKTEKNLIGFGLGVYGFISFLSLFIQ